MNRVQGLLVLAAVSLLALGCSRAKGAAPATIHVASYNLAILGETKLSRSGTMGVLAGIASGFDLVALQEVGSNASTASDESCVRAMDAYLARINEGAQADRYAYIRGNQYAFVYRKDRLRVDAWRLYDGASPFTYTPLVARFAVNGAILDFLAMTVHTRPGEAETEIPALAAAMEEMAAAFGEPDIICLGDFNADGAYYEEGEGLELAGFPSGRFVSVVPNDADTTVAADSLAYDRIVLTSSMAGDYAGNWGVLKPAQSFDLSACEGPGDWAGTERALSDHYPIWADFATGADRD